MDMQTREERLARAGDMVGPSTPHYYFPYNNTNRKDAFRRGFALGMASSFTLFRAGNWHRYHTGRTDLVRQSWAGVGRALWAAIDKERDRHEKALEKIEKATEKPHEST